MNKKGFTLVELMVMTVAAVMLTVYTIPKVLDVLDTSKDELYKTQVSILEKSAKDYYLKHTEELPEDEKDARFLTIDDLAKENMIESSEMIDPRNDEIMNGCIVTKPKGKDYSYTYTEESCSIVNQEYAPKITFKGKVKKKIEVGSDYEFVEAGAKDILGEELSVSGPYLEGKLLTELDTDKVGKKYDLEYRVLDKKRNIKTTKKLPIQIVDTEPPVIRVNGKTKSFTYIQPLSLDALEPFDVQVTDNSGEEVDLEVTSTVSHIKGKGTITYLAKDQYGNITALVVTVQVKETNDPVILKVDGNPTKVQNKGTKLTVSKTKYLGNSVEYSFDGGQTWQKENTKEILENGVVSIQIRDMFGNTSEIWKENITTIDLEKPEVPDVQLLQSGWRGKKYDGNWTNQDVYVLLNSKDEDSSIDYYEYSTDQVHFKKIDRRMYFEEDQNQMYYFRSVDMAGNRSDSTSGYWIRIDQSTLQAPTFVLSSSALTDQTLVAGKKKWTSGDISITQIETKKTGGSPISHYEISGDGGSSWEKADSSYYFNKNMKQVYYFRSVDQAGNKSEKSKAAYIYIDRGKPSTPQVTLKQNNKKGRTYVPGTTVTNPIYMEVLSVDSGSGVDYYQYSLDGVTWEELKKENMTFKGPIQTTLYVRAIDKVGNVSLPYQADLHIIP